MPTMLLIRSRLYITPLLDIRNPTFEKLYRDGVEWSLFKEHLNSPVSDSYVVENVRSYLTEANADGQQSSGLPMIGFYFGRLYGAILSPKTGKLLPNVSALVRFQNEQGMRGYNVGREWYFIDAQPNERTYTDASLLERLQELARDAVTFRDGDETWYYSIGCILGELSGQLFPATSQEYAQWEAENRKWLSEYEKRSPQESDTEALPMVALQET